MQLFPKKTDFKHEYLVWLEYLEEVESEKTYVAEIK